MLLKHSALYLIARGLPGAINLLAIALYTRFLFPGEYGHYTLVMAVVSLINAVFFQWLRLGLLRFFPGYQEQRAEFLSTLAVGFLTLTILTGFIGITASLLWPTYSGLIALSLVLLWIQAWFELNLELLRSMFSPLRYGILATVKALSALIISTILAYHGWGAPGLLFGLILGSLLPVAWITRKEWRVIRLNLWERKILCQFLCYGLPLTVNFALAFVIDSSDRLLLGWLLGSQVAGIYAGGYDLAYQSIGMLMTIVNLAAYPLAVQALKQGDEKKTHLQLSQNITVLLLISLPAAVGLSMLSVNFAEVFLGQHFRETAAVLIPWVALASFLAGIKAYYLDLSFQLGQNTLGQIWVALIAASLNLGMNLWWIPQFGLMGAAYATVIAYLAAFALSLFFGRKIYSLPFPRREIYKIFLAVSVMVCALYPFMHFRGVEVLFGQIFLGAGVYFGGVIALNVMNIREKLVFSLGINTGRN